jgi:hypothetical protein
MKLTCAVEPIILVICLSLIPLIPGAESLSLDPQVNSEDASNSSASIVSLSSDRDSYIVSDKIVLTVTVG